MEEPQGRACMIDRWTCVSWRSGQHSVDSRISGIREVRSQGLDVETHEGVRGERS
jgi:hypothetical protein